MTLYKHLCHYFQQNRQCVDPVHVRKEAQCHNQAAIIILLILASLIAAFEASFRATDTFDPRDKLQNEHNL